MTEKTYRTQADRWGEEQRARAMPTFTLGDFVGEAHHQIERFKANHTEIEGPGPGRSGPGRIVYRSDRRMTFSNFLATSQIRSAIATLLPFVRSFAEWWAVLTERYVHLDLVRLAEIGRAAVERESNRKPGGTSR